MSYLETAFLLVSMGKWTTSYSERVYAQKKFYLNALVKLINVEDENK